MNVDKYEGNFVERNQNLQKAEEIFLEKGSYLFDIHIFHNERGTSSQILLYS